MHLRRHVRLRFAPCLGAPVLPHQSRGDGLAGFFVPHHRGFALIGNAYGGNVAGQQACAAERFLHGRHLPCPHFFGVLLYPACLRRVYRQGPLRTGHHIQLCIKHHAAAGSGALVECEYVSHVVSLFTGRLFAPVFIVLSCLGFSMALASLSTTL